MSTLKSMRDLVLLLARGDLKSVEAVLSELKSKVASDRERGYLKALEGITLSLRKDSPNLYVRMVSGMDCRDIDREIETIRRNFLGKPAFLRDEFQEGFFTCILDFMEALSNNRRIRD